MDHWYVLRTAAQREQEAAGLLRRAVDPALWEECNILRKVKVFRSGGILHLADEILFPGYLLVRSGNPRALSMELEKSEEFPQFLFGSEGSFREIVKGKRYSTQSGTKGDGSFMAVEPADLRFLKNICGENLRQAMGVTGIALDKENRIIRAEGVLSHYLDRIVKLNLHKRFALVEIPLFNRIQSVLFGIRLEQDRFRAWHRLERVDK